MRQAVIVRIKFARFPHSEELLRVPPGMDPAEVVKRRQKAGFHYAVHGTLPECTWKVAESGNLVDALCEEPLC